MMSSIGDDSTRNSRAQSLQGQIGWHCCHFAGYCVYGDKSKIVGARNWLNFGSATNNSSDAVVIVNKDGSHVGVVVDQGTKVWHSPGANSGKPIKSYSFNDFVKYVMPNYVLRK